MRALLSMRPGLRVDIAIDLYKNKEVSFWEAAEIEDFAWKSSRVFLPPDPQK